MPDNAASIGRTRALGEAASSGVGPSSSTLAVCPTTLGGSYRHRAARRSTPRRTPGEVLLSPGAIPDRPSPPPSQPNGPGPKCASAVREVDKPLSPFGAEPRALGRSEGTAPPSSPPRCPDCATPLPRDRDEASVLDARVGSTMPSADRLRYTADNEDGSPPLRSALTAGRRGGNDATALVTGRHNARCSRVDGSTGAVGLVVPSRSS